MLIPITEVATRLGVSVRTIERWMRRPELNFPTGLKIGPKVVRFNEAEVDAWLASRGGAV